MINRYKRMLLLGLAAAAGFAATQALAQTDAQRNAIKSSCRSDYMSKCSSVPPGGAAAFQCLQKNMAGLSSSCQAAVKALEPAAETKPAAPSPAAPKPAAAEAPKPAVDAPKAAAQPAAPATPPPAAAPAAAAATAKPEPAKPAAATPAAKPSEAQVAAIRSACGSDYRRVCSSVPPGGAAAMQCLEQNKAKVGPACAQAIAAASGGGAAAAASPAATAAVAPTTAAAPPAAPAMVLRPLRPLEELRIVRAACGTDARAFCSGVEPGGGRVAQCLAANAGALSPACKGMLAQFAANR
ncbi:hypothetical protein ACQR1Y_05345 [Bradyrhizobium sp. HKCCYLRH3099]|uniref:hypothetical protein n=1 Tax=unclassified Bradyrhizobium TaxID=2631580 RepID=UPI003EBA3490